MTMFTPPTGIKRRADDALDDEQRFTKRFNLLNIVDNPSKLYIPVDTRSTYDNDPTDSTTTASPLPESDGMAIDDTPHRVYVHDLDAELAAIEAEEERDRANHLIFIPDIEQALAVVPKYMLRDHTRDNQGKELVLYGTSEGSTESDEQDVVRRAIMDTKRRAREQWSRQREEAGHDYAVETAHGFGVGDYVEEEPHSQGALAEVDEDAMDIE
ncbi:hypothetical protein K461DRAFT_274825 [Myriangium duriaei CBS 260.36]|uniref:Uncharacterized protein n=1 Tax=Myriangium duriaei CBS 260.36 TaxID=1168546 RepID=A0A9P4JB62_9PEZI|nr:hypothetical protein K461DRAFT_274825 [Myriangium duriaei CBS 260.36]